MIPVELRAPKMSAKTITCTRLIPGKPALEMPIPSAAATAEHPLGRGQVGKDIVAVLKPIAGSRRVNGE